jgi:polysaccharide export outer membrane protein
VPDEFSGTAEDNAVELEMRQHFEEAVAAGRTYVRAAQPKNPAPNSTMRDKMTVGTGVGILMLLTAASLLLNGCATQSQSHSGVLKVTTTTCPYQVSPLDKAILAFADGSSKELIVRHDGTIDVNSGAAKVQGQSIAEFTELLKKEYPTATTVKVKEFKDNRISVLGEVFHQIHTELGNGPMRLMDAIAAANGFTPLADKQHVRLLRENAGVAETYEIDFRQLLRGENMSQNMLVEPGDVITVPRNFL